MISNFLKHIESEVTTITSGLPKGEIIYTAGEQIDPKICVFFDKLPVGRMSQARVEGIERRIGPKRGLGLEGISFQCQLL